MAEKQKVGWLSRRREERRLKQERTGESPEKRSERKKPGDSSVKDASTRAGSGVGGIGLP
jgi:hypothetical protein